MVRLGWRHALVPSVNALPISLHAGRRRQRPDGDDVVGQLNLLRSPTDTPDLPFSLAQAGRGVLLAHSLIASLINADPGAGARLGGGTDQARLA